MQAQKKRLHLMVWALLLRLFALRVSRPGRWFCSDGGRITGRVGSCNVTIAAFYDDVVSACSVGLGDSFGRSW